VRKKRPPPIVTADEVRALRRAVVTADEVKKVGDAQRVYEAQQRSGWDAYYTVRAVLSGPPDARRLSLIQDGAIEAARAGDVRRLVDCLRGRKPLAGGDCDLLAAFIATRARRRYWPGWLADVLRGKLPTEDDYGRLANYVELELRGRRQGRRYNEANHRATRLVETILSLVPEEEEEVRDRLRGKLIDYVCGIEPKANPQGVRNLLDRPEVRRHKH
jgi:hypothetical protein